MRDTGLRARVRRLLDGEFRADDLTRLFLYARDRCDGRETVQEMGDFVAHHAERNKGIITREVRDWFTLTKFMGMKLDQKKIDFGSLPADFPEYLSASFRRMPSRHLQANANVGRARARKLLPGIIEKLTRNQDGSLSWSPDHTATEFAVVKCLCDLLVVRPAFDCERLYADFSAVLKSHALLEKSELRPFEAAKPAVGLFAASLMHNCVIRLEDGSTSQLKAAIHSGNIDVDASVLSLRRDSVWISSAIFATHLDSATYCEADLLMEPQPWACDLEVSPAGRLAKLG